MLSWRAFPYNFKLTFVVVVVVVAFVGQFRTCAFGFPGERSEAKPGVLTVVVPCCACTDGRTTVARSGRSSPSCPEVNRVRVRVQTIHSFVVGLQLIGLSQGLVLRSRR